MNDAILGKLDRKRAAALDEMHMITNRILKGERLEDFLPVEFPDQELFVLRGSNHTSETQYVVNAFYRERFAMEELLRTQLNKQNVGHPFYLVSGTASEISSGKFVDSKFSVPFSQADVSNVYASLEKDMRVSAQRLVDVIAQRMKLKELPWYSPRKWVALLKK